MSKRVLITILLSLQILSQLMPVGLTQTVSIAQQQAPGTSQSEPQQPKRADDDDVVKITTNLVQVDAVVTDKNGRQVTDLRPEEVEIREDGKAQKITSFSYVALDSPGLIAAKPTIKNAPAPPSRLRPEQVRRTIALVVDDLGLSFESAYYVRQALKRFLDQQMRPDDLVAIIRTGGGIGALQQFTSDKRQLLAAVEKVKWNPLGRAGIGAFGPINNESTRSLREDDSRAARNDDLDQFREDIFAVGTLGAVNYIVRGLRELPGRKSVVLISDGIKIFNRSEPTGNVRILTALQSLTDLANRASVVIYTMDARGLQTVGLTAADSTWGLRPDQIEERLRDRRIELFESQDGLNYLARQTGGLAIRGNNDLAGALKQLLEDQGGYYLIGYRPDDSTFDQVSGRRKFHRLGLKVTRGGKFNVRMRNGFYGITDDDAVPAARTPAQQILAALTSPFGASGVQLRLTSLFANDPTAGSFMRSMLHIRGRDLTFTDTPDGWHKAVFDIVAITFGDNGVVVDQISRTHTIRVRGRTFERIQSSGFTYNVTVPVKKAGAYQLRAVLRDVPSNRLGAASQFIEVPDIKKNRLTISGILASGMNADADQRSASESSSGAAEGLVEEQDSNAGATLRQFKSGSVMVYGFVIYNAQIDRSTGKPQLQTQLRLFRDGQQVFTGKEIAFDSTNQTDLKRLAASGAIQLGSELRPGEYQLQVVVTDPLAKEKYRVATQWIDFEIVK